MANKPVLDDYNTVPERIEEFRRRYPNGILRAEYELVRDFGGADWIVATAYAYKDAEDKVPATGVAWERVPGLTPYTKNSELQNAETSAWGRALIANGSADAKKGIASASEVTNRQAERDPKVLADAIKEAKAAKTIEDARAAYKTIRALGATQDQLDELAQGFVGLPSAAGA
jgi:hypothetical protein